jgi:hypothetical protein
MWVFTRKGKVVKVIGKETPPSFETAAGAAGAAGAA